METKIGERLSKLRIENNMTQEEFANKIGISRQSVSKWELDKSYPDLDKLVSIAELFDVSTDYLLTGVEPKVANIDVDKDNTLIEEEDEICVTAGSITSKAQSLTKRVNLGLHICRVIVGIMLVFMATVFCVALSKNAWDKSESKKVIAQVEQVYNQYTKADVSFFDDDLKQVQRTVWLDEAGIREGDLVVCYTNDNQDDIYSDYNSETLIVPGVIMITLLGVFVILSVEVRRIKED